MDIENGSFQPIDIEIKFEKPPAPPLNQILPSAISTIHGSMHSYCWMVT